MTNKVTKMLEISMFGSIYYMVVIIKITNEIEIVCFIMFNNLRGEGSVFMRNECTPR